MESLLKIDDLVVSYPTGSGWGRRKLVTAVDGVSLEIARGETLALVGESGCGKSSLARAILGLTPVASGRIEFNGANIAGLKESSMRAVRRHLQMVFQDSYACLDPRMTAMQTVEEPLRSFDICPRSERKARARELLDLVGLGAEYTTRRPRHLSGGQRQRIGIARALGSEPELIVADEPVSALDVSIQAQILNLLKRLAKQRNLACLFISHDLRAVARIADRVAVMYAGKIVETGPTSQVLEQPENEYTRTLLAASLSFAGTRPRT